MARLPQIANPSAISAPELLTFDRQESPSHLRKSAPLPKFSPSPRRIPSKAAKRLKAKGVDSKQGFPLGGDVASLPLSTPVRGDSPSTPLEGVLIEAEPDIVPDLPDPNNDTIDLPYGLVFRPYQEEVWEYMMQPIEGLRALTVWPRRNGKDLIALNILIAKAVQRVGLYLYIGPLHTQTRQIVWMGQTNGGRPFLEYIPPKLVKKKRDAVMEIDLVNGSMIKVVGSDQYDNLMGLNCVGAVFTEYSLQRPEAWDYIRPMMAENGGWALFNGTPRGLNHMHDMARMAKDNPKWFYQYLTRDDTGRPSLAAIEDDRRGGMKESKIEQEYYCSWTSSSESAFIPLDLIDPTLQMTAQLSKVEYKHSPRILGCDVAYAAKGDKATICFRQGRKVHWLRWYLGRDNMAFAREIAKYIKLVKPHAVFIDAGRGEGVISRLHSLGFDHIVFGVHFNGKVYEEGIANMKALMWHRMLKWFLDTNIPDMSNLDNSIHANEEVEEQLAKELSTPHLQEDEKKQIKVESKTSLKSRGESSPDLAESLGLTFAEELEQEDLSNPRLEELGLDHETIEQLSRADTQHSYDPLSYMQDLQSSEQEEVNQWNI